MKRQSAAVSNGKSRSNGYQEQGESGDGLSVSNGNWSTKTRNGNAKPANGGGEMTKSSGQKISSEELGAHGPSGGVLFSFFSRSLVPLFLMFFSPNLVIWMWYVNVRCDGSWLQLIEIFEVEGFVGGLTKMWFDIHIASPLSVAVLIGYMLWALILMVIVPGPRAEGPVTPFGKYILYFTQIMTHFMSREG
jgi:hypothetical protein